MNADGEPSWVAASPAGAPLDDDEDDDFGGAGGDCDSDDGAEDPFGASFGGQISPSGGNGAFREEAFGSGPVGLGEGNPLFLGG